VSRRLGARPAATLSLLAGPLAVAMALSGCAAGTDAVTTNARTSTNAVSGAIGTISIRNVYVVGPATSGGSAQVISAFFNGGVENDTLTGVSSPVAGSGQPPTNDVLTAGGGNIYLAGGGAPTLAGLKQNLLIGQAVPVTFTFAKAGSVTLDAPVESPAPGASVSPSPAATATTGAATASATVSPGTVTASPTP
jgi:copper(I)-binding protein